MPKTLYDRDDVRLKGTVTTNGVTDGGRYLNIADESVPAGDITISFRRPVTTQYDPYMKSTIEMDQDVTINIDTYELPPQVRHIDESVVYMDMEQGILLLIEGIQDFRHNRINIPGLNEYEITIIATEVTQKQI